MQPKHSPDINIHFLLQLNILLMDSPQSVVSPLKTSSVHPEPKKQQTPKTYPPQEMEINFQSKDIGAHEEDNQLGTLDVYIHQARDIHNICIYQKQDVYAKLCLTSDPERSVSTKIIHGGGHNPVFNEGLRLGVRNPDSSLKCEIWMLSRVRNYMEDQLLGFALVPLSEVLLQQGGSRLQKEFSLSSTDLFHSPAGFVELSVSYVGAQPDVIRISAPLPVPDSESITSLVNEFDQMEFPDPKVANENDQMVEEYIEICTKAEEESQCAESLVSSDAEDGARPEESLSAGSELKANSSPSEISSASAQVSSESSETSKDRKSPAKEPVLGPEEKPKEKSENRLDAKNGDVSGGVCGSVKPLVSVNVEPEPELVQQDIVDMYMKSMQQFTESLAKMKLPMDYENGPSSSENSTTSDHKTPSSKNSGSRVFYGSRAFF
ncbi:Calcium-dependent lipid-binding (CaLB domain) family protein [Striga hermonthica]|uniref:Calcium-dependent lipid-binding (CaLB domain) family protein n=1 Tax=Striga hermonthica TaxID=68872 RepID=A0A9N7NLX2_STRHE|nr:Calcium-dependent lipid-binding (CaLB domain) family protein [Striga hermonthica]